jgi:prophage DNA circulation protein
MTELDKMKTDQRSRTDMVASVERQLLEAQMANVEMVRGAMSNAMAGLAVTAHILNGAVGLAARVSRALDDPAYCPSPREAASLLRVLMHTGHFANESARIAQELQQAVAEATNIKKVAGGMTVEEAQQVIESTGRSAARLARAQARGQLPEAPKVFDVGQASPQEDILSDDGDEFEGDEESQDFDHVQSA